MPIMWAGLEDRAQTTTLGSNAFTHLAISLALGQLFCLDKRHTVCSSALVCVQVRFLCCWDKINNGKQPGAARVFWLTGYNLSPMETKAGTWRQERMERLEGKGPLACSACFLGAPRITRTAKALPTWAGPTPVNH